MAFVSRYKKLAASGNNKPQIVTGIARELLGFAGPIAAQLNCSRKTVWAKSLVPLRSNTGVRRGAHGRRTLRTFTRYGPVPDLAFSVRGSSRRITTVRFRLADVIVINRRTCPSLRVVLLLMLLLRHLLLQHFLIAFTWALVTLDKVAPYQKLNFAASCTTRFGTLGLVEVIVPNALPP